ncbi:DUF2207 domain-containing protein [Leuconostoc suionicum]|uniref:DUF2207 domain-containing protein n=1 Tax=Leuconostoc suionicum TaxID=1511761 RepID=UPI0021AAB7DA|nr:DUF2207 domain-containing protein [Leuconostoc suionicum]MCT4382414.1 DUF2207 domain-containing protein [Leuconostoc suionicum]
MLKLKIVVFTFLFAMMGVLTVSADGDYRITDLNEVVQIDANGDANITKKVTYHFDDEMDGVYFKESLKKGTDSQSLQWGGLTSIEVSHNNGEKQTILPRQGDSSYGYVETKTSQQVQEKIYYPVQENDQLTMFHHYTLKDVVVNWDDIAEINWLPIGTRDVAIEKLRLEFVLPNQPVSTLKAWVHGRSVGNVLVNKKQANLIVNSGKIGPDDTVEVHTYFDTSQTPLNTNKQSGNRAAYIQKQEKAIVLKNKKTLQIKKVIGFIVSPIVILILVFIIILKTIQRRKLFQSAREKSGVTGDIVHIFDIPNDIGPALVSERIAKSVTNAKLIIATLLDLIARRKIAMTYDDIQKQDGITYSVLDETNLQPFELVFINMIFGKYRRPVVHAEFKQPESGVSNRIKKDISSFTKALKEAEKQASIIDHVLTNKIKNQQFFLTLALIISTIISTFLLGIFAYSTQVWSMWYVSFTEIIVVILVLIFSIKPAIFYKVPNGFQEKWQWDGFAKMLHDIAHLENKTVLDVQLWDKLLAYAVIFGEAKNVAKQMKVWSQKVDTDDSIIFVPIMLYGDNWSENFIYNVENDGAFHVDNNVNGDGGGFSTGSSGGAGGGSDGAF